METLLNVIDSLYTSDENCKRYKLSTTVAKVAFEWDYGIYQYDYIDGVKWFYEKVSKETVLVVYSQRNMGNSIFGYLPRGYLKKSRTLNILLTVKKSLESDYLRP